jgi:hypothetical protein
MGRATAGYSTRMTAPGSHSAAPGLLDRARTALAATGGAALGGAARAVALVRPAAKPLHPRGEVLVGRLRRHGTFSPTGVAWLDSPSADPEGEEVLVRRSRAVGLPGALPDVHGLAIRVPLPDRVPPYGDLLFASTGFGLLSRFLLVPTWEPGARPLTTLLPYRAPAGPLLLGVREQTPGSFELSYAVGSRPFEAFAELALGETRGDPTVSFDAVVNRLPGLEQYDWVTRLREPAYALARSSRR